MDEMFPPLFPSSCDTPKNPHQLIWSIKNFLKGKKTRPLLSPHFPPTTVGSPGYKFQLEVSQNNAMVFFYVYMVEGKENQEMKYRIYLLDKNLEKRFVTGGIGKFSAGGKELAKHQFNALPIKHLLDNDFLCDGNMIILCEINVPGWDISRTKSYAIDLPITDKKANQIADDFHILFDTGKLSDMKIIFGQREFAAHKLILAARSPVLGNLLTFNFKVDEETRLVLEDIDEETGEELLRYIYTEKVYNLKRLARSLLIAADKCELDSLRRECEHSLSSNLSIDSATDILLLADMHRAPLLRDKCIDFITDHSQKVVATEGWKEVSTHPELLNLLFSQLALKDSVFKR